MQRGKRPSYGRRHQPVLDRIEMDVVSAPFKILVISNGMFPEPPLPNGVFASVIAWDRSTCCHHTPRKRAFDSSPPIGKIGITFRQGPDRVQVIR
jgi:hypothetical protein